MQNLGYIHDVRVKFLQSRMAAVYEAPPSGGEVTLRKHVSLN